MRDSTPMQRFILREQARENYIKAQEEAYIDRDQKKATSEKVTEMKRLQKGKPGRYDKSRVLNAQ